MTRPNLWDKVYHWFTGEHTKAVQKIREAEFNRMREEAEKLYKQAKAAKAVQTKVKAKVESKPAAKPAAKKTSVAKPKATPKAAPKATGKTSTSPSKKKPSK